MAQLTRKQREIQERETEILRVAREIFITEGYHGLSMEKIAAEMEYAKGTIYNHFPNKEEIMIALANAALSKRTELFRRAATHIGKSRQRITAICAANDIFNRRFPSHFRVEFLIRSQSIWDKTSEKGQNTLKMCESKCMEAVAGIVRDGVASGDLKLPKSLSPEEFVFGMWSMSLGAYSIVSNGRGLDELGIENPLYSVRQNLFVFLDGVNWKPLSSKVDYEELFNNLQREIFAEELAEISE